MTKHISQYAQIQETPVPVVPVPGLNLQVKVAETSVIVAGPTTVGGYIINPSTAENQGLDSRYDLFVDPTGPAETFESNTTIALRPGQIYILPANTFRGVWVNSLANGHKFTAVQIVPLALMWDTQAELDALYQKGNFPPTGPSGVLHSIKSYLYQEYSMDDDLQAFVRAYNDMQQDIVDTFNGLNLPNYTQYPISGALLDWVAEGVYGLKRPSLGSGEYTLLGPYNTGEYNTQVYNDWQLIYPDEVCLTNDDIFRRILTWHISKRECKYFSIEWLKRRIMKFLIGKDGKQPNVDQHYQISVTFGPNYEVTIRFVLYIRTLTGGALYDFTGSQSTPQFQYNALKYNEIESSLVTLPPLPNMKKFQEGVISGVLELPFQFKFNVVIG